MSTPDTWNRLVRKTRHKPFIDDPVMSATSETLTVSRRGSPFVFIIVTLFSGLLIWCTMYMALRPPGLRWGPVAGFVFVFGALIAGSAYLWLYRASVSFAAAGDELMLRYGCCRERRSCTMNRKDLSVHLILGAAKSQYLRDQVLAVLRDEETKQEVSLLGARDYALLVGPFRALRGFLGRGDDHTAVSVSLEDGRQLAVSKAWLSDKASEIATEELRILSPDLALVRPRGFGLLPGGVLTLLGAGTIVFGCVSVLPHFQRQGPFTLIPIVFGLMSLTAGLAWSASETEFRFDRRLGELTAQPCFLRVLRRPEHYKLADLAAIQLCAKTIRGSDSPDWTCYELNLVLIQPEGRRLNLMSHADRPRIGRDAQQISEFLGLPLLDHTDGLGTNK